MLSLECNSKEKMYICLNTYIYAVYLKLTVFEGTREGNVKSIYICAK